MASILGSAVFQMTASTVGLAAGLAKGLSIVISGMKGGSTAMANSQSQLVQALSLVAFTASAATTVILSFAAGIATTIPAVSLLAMKTGELRDALSNVGQTFG